MNLCSQLPASSGRKFVSSCVSEVISSRRSVPKIFFGTAAIMVFAATGIGQTDPIFESTGTNSWQTKDDRLYSDGSPMPSHCPDDGYIFVDGSYSKDFGPDASVLIKHKIILHAPSGISGRDGDISSDGPLGSANGESGTPGTGGRAFSIMASVVTIRPEEYQTCSSGNYVYVRAGVIANGGSGGSGGDGGGYWVNDTLTRGAAGAGASGGSGGSIVFNADSVYLEPVCEIVNGWTTWHLPELTANGGSGGSAGLHLSDGLNNYGPVGSTGQPGGSGGSGGSVHFGKANVTMCPQPAELFAVNCTPDQQICTVSMGGDCLTPSQTQRLGYMRLPISVGGGSGGSGGDGTNAFDTFNVAEEDYYKCLGTSPDGGAGGNGGDGGTVLACTVLPILFSGAGGNGGNGGPGGDTTDWANYLWSANGGTGGAGGSGGSAPSGCGAVNESAGGQGGQGGGGGGAILEYGCSWGQEGADGSSGGPAPTIDYANPICACGIGPSGMDSGSSTYQLGTPYSGSVVLGKNLACQVNGLEIYLQGNGLNRRVYIAGSTSNCDGDSLTIWINKNEFGQLYSPEFPSAGIYNLYFTNGTCDATLADAITIESAPPQGSSCENPLPVSCGAFYHYTQDPSDTDNPLPAASPDVAPCAAHPDYPGLFSNGEPAAGDWLSVTIPAWHKAVVTVEDSDIWHPALAYYSACPSDGSVQPLDCQFGGGSSPLITGVYENPSDAPMPALFLVNWHEQTMAYSVRVECVPMGKDCSDPISISCGETQTGTMAGATDTFFDEACSIGGVDRWWTITPPAGHKLKVTFNANEDQSIGIYSGGCPNPTRLTCDADSGGKPISVEIETDGSTYYIIGETLTTAASYSIATECIPLGSSCAAAYSAQCGSSFSAANPIPGVGTDASPCFEQSVPAAYFAGRWLKINLQARQAVTVSATEGVVLAETVGVAFYTACGQLAAPAISKCEIYEVSATYSNMSTSGQMVYVLVNSLVDAGHPDITVTCSKIPVITGGWGHIEALDYAAGTPRGWAQNASGQLGDGSTTHQPIVDIRPPSLATTALKWLVGGGKHSMALMPDNTIRTWGWNRYNTLGNGEGGDRASDAFDRTLPVDVVTALGGPTFTGAKSINCGPYHSQTIKTDATLWCWGYNAWGQLGNGNQTDSKVPVQVKNGDGSPFTEVRAVEAGHSHSIALVGSAGEVWGWGRNHGYELGIGVGGATNDRSLIPVQTQKTDGTPLTGIQLVRSFNWSNVALDSGGTLWSWGRNEYGQLGNGGTADKPQASPVKNADGTDFSDVTDVAVGGYHVLAVKKDGSVWAWGDDRYGQLGNDNAANTAAYNPVRVKAANGVDDFTDAVAVYAGDWYSFILKKDGTLWSWGANWNGQLATNMTFTARYLPDLATAFPQQ